MTEQSEHADFARRYAADEIEIVVLTGEMTGGARKPGGQQLWTATAEVVAYLDEHGAVVTADDGRLSGLDLDVIGSPQPETCHRALTQLRRLVSAAASLDADWRSFAATELTSLANNWQSQGDPTDATASAKLDAEQFAGRIGLRELSVAADGSVLAYYDDDDLFWGHVIVVEVESNLSIRSADIAAADRIALEGFGRHGIDDSVVVPAGIEPATFPV